VSGSGHRRIAGRLVIATHNPGKLREMRELLALARKGVGKLVDLQKMAVM
jgi:inosine/xanthosine triphosphate pyrophosphatase family protein